MEKTKAGESGVILLVEDEKGIRSLIRRALTAAGYEVIDTDQAEAAVTMASSHPRPVRLLVTDSLMPEGSGFKQPEMSGAQLAAELVRRQPDLKVLFISGYANQDLTSPIPLPEGQEFLQKPFTMADLVERAKRILGD